MQNSNSVLPQLKLVHPNEIYGKCGERNLHPFHVDATDQCAQAQREYRVTLCHCTARIARSVLPIAPRDDDPDVEQAENDYRFSKRKILHEEKTNHHENGN